MQKRIEQTSAQPRDLSSEILALLRAGKLPRMVDWLDPVMLAHIGMRTIVSSTLGEYADQRLMQAATDRVSETDLARRYDYSKECAKPTPQCPLWVDYISDLGDGFEATYAMAYLMSQDALRVRGDTTSAETIGLDAGEILIMGGDQAYPQSSALEYQHRLLDPYNWAFTPGRPGQPGAKERKLFVLPGNHDWYDGLGAFDSLFCSARDRMSEGEGKLIGGWRCKQHRSYFAIRLPHDWWIWGADIQLAGVFDDPQRDYFDIKSKETGPDSKIVLCLAEPSWTHENYDNLFEIVTIAQSNGAKVCAVLAGDLHHYSRYVAVRSLEKHAGGTEGNSPLLNTQFVTCGGGGAFAHATHGLKRTLELKWPVEGAIDADKARSMQGVQAYRGPLLGEDALRREEIKVKRYEMERKKVYPSSSTSRLLSLKNLWLPLHNKRFALAVGLIYFMFAWVFLSTDNALHPAFQKMWPQELTGVWKMQGAAYKDAFERKERVLALEADPKTDPAVLEAAKKDAANAQEFYEGLDKFFNAIEVRNAASLSKKAGERLPIPQTILQTTAEGPFDAYKDYSFKKTLETILNPMRAVDAAWANPAFFFMLIGLWAGLIHYAHFEWGGWHGIGALAKISVGTVHFLAHIAALLFVCAVALSLTIEAIFHSAMIDTMHPGRPEWVHSLFGTLWMDRYSSLVQPAIMLLYALTFIVLGGLLGAFIFGLYWALMSTLFARHKDDAFGALGLRHYKHFLRLKFEKDRLTIYPIAIDTVPGRTGWAAAGPEHAGAPYHSPKIVPQNDLGPHLIEGPIVISA